METPQVSFDLSIFSLFFHADLVVQIIMVGLLIASILCWAIIFNKWYMLRNIRKRVRAFEAIFWSGLSLNEILEHKDVKKDNPMTLMFVSAMREWNRSDMYKSGILIRIERIMYTILRKETEQMDTKMSVLASIGSASPFIGLLGTVWGIMNSFTNIAATKQTSLIVVAPGIAEALFATALGLFAAIPATIAYNKLSSDIDAMQAKLESFVDEFTSIISRRVGE